jgi:hypothetical protein
VSTGVPTDLFEGAGDTFWSSLGTSAMYSPLTVLNTAKNNLLAKEQQEQQGTPTVSEEQQNQLNTMPNKPQLPPDEGGASGGNLMTPEGMQQAGVESPEQTQLAQANQVIQEVINNDNVATSIEGQPVDIKELTPEGVVLIDGQVVPVESVMVESELGTNPLVDVINEYINQQENAVQIESTSSEVPLNGETGQTIPQGSEGVRQGEQGVETTQQGGQEKVTVVPELPKKIFHATNAQFEGQPSRQEQSKVSAFGTEPAGVFYSTNPDQAKQAIGNGENARIIEADFNPKNPLVINNINDDTYFNTSKEAEQQAIEEFREEYSQGGMDLDAEAANENLPEAVNKRTSEIFAEKLKEQGFDAVINQESGDIIVLDPSAVVDSYTVDEADMNNVDNSQAEVEYNNEYDNTGLSDRGKLLKASIDAIDDVLNNKGKPLSNTAKFRLKDMSTLLLKGDINGLVNLALLNIKTPVLLKDGVLNNGTKVKGIGVNKKDTWIPTSTDANKSMSYDELVQRVTEYVTDQIGQISQTDTQGNASVAELIANADIPNMVYDIITGSKEDAYNTLKAFQDADIDVNALQEEKTRLEDELANEAMWEQKFKSEGNPKQKSGTFVNKELESDIPKVIEYLAKMKELEDGTKKRNIQTKIDEITSKDAKLKKIIENFDVILKQLNYTSDC